MAKSFIVVGAGLGGALMVSYLARAGHRVTVYERRQDPRKVGAKGGRSINLALSTRGIHALEQVEVAPRVLEAAVPMRGRVMHSERGELTFQPYGTRAHHYLNSVPRGLLNAILVEAAESHSNTAIHFGKKCVGLDLDTATVRMEDVAQGGVTSARADAVIGADGAFSAVCRRLQREPGFDFQQSYLRHGYKELTIPPSPDGRFRMRRDALHIWPRGGFMMIALPNRDGSFTCTLFSPFEGPNSFAEIDSEERVSAFFGEHFPDALSMMPTLAEDFFRNPVGSLVTIRTRPWSYRDRVVMLGDACHAVVPFYGQGANASFEDCTVLSECIGRNGNDLGRAFSEYDELRKANLDTLADLAIGNFTEMRDHVASRSFLIKKKTESTLHRLLGDFYLPLYTMVTFTRIPYAEAVRRHRRQQRSVLGFAAAVLAVLVLATVWALT